MYPNPMQYDPNMMLQGLGLTSPMQVLNAGGVPSAAPMPLPAGGGVLSPEFASLAGTDAIKPQGGLDLNHLAMIGQALQGLTAKKPAHTPPAPSPVNVGSGPSINAKALLPVGQALLPGMRG